MRERGRDRREEGTYGREGWDVIAIAIMKWVHMASWNGCLVGKCCYKATNEAHLRAQIELKNAIM